jgi:myosin-crossreactive antigen
MSAKRTLVGSGIANLAAAVCLIKDGGFSGENINIAGAVHVLQ